MNTALDSASLGQRELIVTRIFDAPRERVFRAWTDPKQAVQWWGAEASSRHFS